MSLINEALKRAESERRQYQGDAPAASMGDAPAPEPATDQPRPRAAGTLVVVVSAIVCGLTYLSMPPEVKPRPSGRALEARAGAGGPAAASGSLIPAVKRLPAAEPTEASPPSPPSPAAAKPLPAGATSRPAGATAAATSRPAFEASQFRLGAILKSAAAAHAVIDGHMVKVGDQVKGARVVAIEQYHVVLEKAGKRLVLRM